MLAASASTAPPPPPPTKGVGKIIFIISDRLIPINQLHYTLAPPHKYLLTFFPYSPNSKTSAILNAMRHRDNKNSIIGVFTGTPNTKIPTTMVLVAYRSWTGTAKFTNNITQVYEPNWYMSDNRKA